MSIALVQHTNKDAGSVSSTTLAYGSNIGSGNLLLVVIRSGGTTGVPFTVSDTLTNSWTGLTAQTVGGIGSTQAWWAISNGAGADTITVTLNSAQTLRISIYEYSGVAASSPLDLENNSQTSGSGNPAAVSITPAGDNELVIGFVATGASTTATAGTNYALEDVVPAAPNTRLSVEDWIQTIATATTAPQTITGGVSWMAGIMSFKPAGVSTAIFEDDSFNPRLLIPNEQNVSIW